MYLQESNKIPVKHIVVLYLVSIETFLYLLLYKLPRKVTIP